MNNGYWAMGKHVSDAEIARFAKVLEHVKRTGDQLVVTGDVRFVPFGPGATPDALCRYCWSPNLHTSTSCEKCGAPLVHG